MAYTSYSPTIREAVKRLCSCTNGCSIRDSNLGTLPRGPLLLFCPSKAPPCSFWKRASENFLENSLYTGISPPAKGLEALQNEQCSTCPVVVDSNGWGNRHWGIRTVHCQLRPQTAPQPLSALESAGSVHLFKTRDAILNDCLQEALYAALGALAMLSDPLKTN